MQLLQEHQVNIITEVVVSQLLPDYRRELEEFEASVAEAIVNHLRFTVGGKLSLMVVEPYDIIIAKVKRSIDPVSIIADIIL